MLSRLLSAAALAALLGCPLTAHAQSHKWDGITAEEVTAYMDRMFSDENPGFLVKRDGKIYRFNQPFNILFRHPECESSARASAMRFKQEAGLDVNFEGSGQSVLDTSLGIFGLATTDDYKNESDLYPQPLYLLYKNEDAIKDAVDNVINDGYVAYNQLHYNYGKIIFAVLMINKNIIKDPYCNMITDKLLFISLTNSTVSHSIGKIDNIDMLFVSALYDQTINVGQTEDSARSQIVQIMLNKIKGDQ